MLKKILVILVLGGLGISGILFSSCGGGDGDSASTGVVALYATDDLSNYEQVITTINSIQLIHTGSNSACTILNTPETVDITDLSSEVQLLNTATCPARSYNRVRLEFDKQVLLMDPLREMASCTWRNYKGDNNNVNTLDCSETTCTLDINGAVNVFANQNNKLALDFDLKDFEVEQEQVQSTYNCEATMKVSPLNASGIEGKKGQGYRESINGSITDLDTTGDSFTIEKGVTTFGIDYSGINEVSQTAIDDLLQFAVDNNLNVKVKCDIIDLETNSCTASAIYVKVEGTISELNETSETFILTFLLNTEEVEITVDYSGAVVEGSLANEVNVNVQLYGYDGTNYLAYKVCVEG